MRTLPENFKMFHPRGDMKCVVTSPFGWRKLNGVRQFHAALDFRGAVGSQVFAMLDGEVIRTDAVNPRGLPDGYHHLLIDRTPVTKGADILLRHANGLYTRYSHLSESFGLKKGDKVSAGSLIGLTGYAPAPHLHAEAGWDYEKRAGTYFSDKLRKGDPSGESFDFRPYLTTNLGDVWRP